MITRTTLGLTLVRAAWLLALLPAGIRAQDSLVVTSAPRTTWWVGGGYGRGWSAHRLATAESFTLNLSGQRGDLLLSSRVSAVSESPDETTWDVGVLAGVASSPIHPVHGGLAVGLGYAEWEPGRQGAAVPLEAQLFWRFSRAAGVGAYVFASVGDDSFAGLTLAVQAGRLR